MNKEEIEHKLEQAKADSFEINKQVQILEAQLREFEKPKLRHGDFGILDDYGAYTAVRCASNLQVKKGEILLASSGGLTPTLANKKVYTDQWRYFGNIFDLMKGEDLTYFTLDVHHYEINTIDFPHAPIHIAGNWHTEAEAYKFWCDFGQMLMTLKRKANQ